MPLSLSIFTKLVSERLVGRRAVGTSCHTGDLVRLTTGRDERSSSQVNGSPSFPGSTSRLILVCTTNDRQHDNRKSRFKIIATARAESGDVSRGWLSNYNVNTYIRSRIEYYECPHFHWSLSVSCSPRAPRCRVCTTTHEPPRSKLTFLPESITLVVIVACRPHQGGTSASRVLYACVCGCCIALLERILDLPWLRLGRLR
jgi:hypothetical protein